MEGLEGGGDGGAVGWGGVRGRYRKNKCEASGGGEKGWAKLGQRRKRERGHGKR